VAYPKALTKLGTKLFTEGLDPVAAWRALGVADRETIVHGSELLGTLSVISGASAALFGDDNMSVDERILDAVNPLGSKGWTLQFGDGKSMPLAAPLRAGIRTAASAAVGVGVPLDKIPGAQTRGDPAAPVKYVGNRLISIPSMIYHLAIINKDWQGREIIDGDTDFKGKLLQSVMYGMESASIITSPTIHAVRTGEMGNAGMPATPLGVVKETLEAQAGLNIYDPSRTTQYRAVQSRVMNELIQDGTISPEFAQQIKDSEYTELPSSLRKMIDNQLKERYPDANDWYQRGRRADASPFQITADAADTKRAEYAEVFTNLQKKLFNGEDPSKIWPAYELQKAELRGALKTIYSDNKEYNEAILSLEVGDMRKIEDDYFAITEAMYTRNSGALTDAQYDELAQSKAAFLTKLNAVDPEKAKFFVYALQIQEQTALDESHPMEAIRKQARTVLAPYYDLPEDDLFARQKYLRENPDADVAKWLTSSTESPAVNSVGAAEMALGMIPKRNIHLSGSNLPITENNLPILKQYDKEITTMFEQPSSLPYPNDPSRNYSPRTELRKQSPLHDALWFWLGMNKPDADKKDNAVSVYHPQQVQQYLRIWGSRFDSANIKGY